ncbi:MAG TPA: DUF1592 domain-containing protein [Opitutaceae bacterium]|nr:DUF1592 domain-containing protein [Opitutaceae bacterium]
MRTTEPKARSFLGNGVAVCLLGFCLLLAACVRPAGSTRTGPQASASLLAAATVKVAPAVAPAKRATPWDEFHKTVQPFLAEHCYTCHGDANAENNFRLDLIHDDASLEDGSRTLEKAFEKLASHKMPPSEEPQPLPAEVAPVVGWLRTYLAGDPTGPINPGRVTLRRLNRAEYNNTIRDLLAIDIRPADNFPVDDAGYGFDNNGDVLSLAPVLMEKYLSSAGLAVEKAIYCDPVVPPPLQRWDATIAEGTMPKSDPAAVASTAPPGAAPLPPGITPRRAMPLGRVFKSNGEIFADYDVTTDGDYVLRVRAYGTQGSANRQRPQVAFAVDGAPVQKPFTIKEDQRNTSVYALEKEHLTAGRHRISLAMLNGATPEEAAAEALKPAPPPKTEAELAAEEAAAIAAENAAEAAALAAATAKPPANGAPAGARGRAGGVRGGAAGRGGASGARGDGPPGPAKPTLGVIYFEVEGPLEPTLDRMPDSYRKVMIARPSATVTKQEAAEKIVRHFASRAYRRPVNDEELGELMVVWTKADSAGSPFDQSVDVALQAVLVSPAFLFRMELEPQPGEPREIHTLSEYELASRLSYFLWSSMPDDELFALAEKGKLRANLTAQVRRMLKDPKSSALVENFAGQWLQLRSMQNVTPDTKNFPEFDEALREAMTKETELFFNAIVQEDRSVLDFIDADFTYVNARLAKHYGMTEVTGDDFRRVSLAGKQRGGLLTQASILTITSYPGRTSPVQRGKWVLENLFDAAPPPPPPNVPPLAEGAKAELTGTLRQRMEQHRANPTCATCHAQMDGIGFALENFDAVGAWRTEDGGEKIDAAGTLPGGKSFNGPVELRQIIKSQSDQFVNCLVGKMLTFALGRGMESYDRRTRDGIADVMKKNGEKFSVLIEEIVRSDAFQKRNGKHKKGDT